MSAVEALRLAEKNGVHLGVAGADLILDADREPAPRVLDAIRRHKAEIVALLGSAENGWVAEDWRAFFEERAGIAEFDGGLSRADAEKRAFECCVAEWLNTHPPVTENADCPQCGRHIDDTCVPILTGTDARTWLHSRCWAGWIERRRQGAVDYLTELVSYNRDTDGRARRIGEG